MIRKPRHLKPRPRRMMMLLVASFVALGATQAMASESIGDLVWNDANNNGIRDAGEPGIPGVTVSVYNDGNRDCVPDGPAIQTQQTIASGGYLFPAVGMGWVIVRIEPSNFATGGPLNGYVSSTGSIPESNNPADNNKDHGVPNGGGIDACQVGIFPPEPVGEGLEPGLSYPADDLSDSNHQTTIDFGVYRPGTTPPVTPPVTPPTTPPVTPPGTTPPTTPPTVVGNQNTTLRITKRPPTGPLALGKTSKLTIIVKNTGKVAATNAKVCWIVRPGFQVVEAKGAVRNGAQLCWTVASLAPGATGTWAVRFRPTRAGNLPCTATARASNAPAVRADGVLFVPRGVAGVRRDPVVTG